MDSCAAMYILWPSFIYGLPKRTQAATGEHRYRDRPTHTYSCDAAATAAADMLQGLHSSRLLALKFVTGFTPVNFLISFYAYLLRLLFSVYRP